MVKIVNREFLPFIWPSISRYIDMALDKANGEILLDDVYRHIDEETYLLIVAFDESEIPLGAVTLDVQEFDRKTKVTIVHCGGRDIEQWKLDMWNLIKLVAKNKGADCITLTGRAGWLKMIPDKESRKHTILEYDI